VYTVRGQAAAFAVACPLDSELKEDESFR